MLREMMSSAFAHSFKRFAKLAMVGLALAGLTACGGGGGGDPEPGPCPQGQVRGDDGQCRTPTEMTITPTTGGDSFAEATDITDKETIEGQLDSADDVDYFQIRVDEPTEVTLWMDNPDVEFQVLDSEGNELVTSLQNSGGGSSSGLVAASAATPQAAPALLCLTPAGAATCARILVVTGRIVIRVAVRQGRNISRATKYTLRKAARTGVKAIRVTQRFVKKNLEVGKPEDINLDAYYSSEGGTTLSYSARLVTLSLGPYKLGVNVTGSTLRLSPESSSECRGRAESRTVKIGLVASAKIPPAEGLPEEVRESLESISQVSFLERTLVDNGPRLRPASPGLSLTVREGYTVPIALHDHIGGDTLAFSMSGSAPTGLEVRRTDANWWVTAQEGAMGGAITVAATDENNVCRTFPLEVMVLPATTLTVKPDHREGVSGTVAPGETYTSQHLSNYVIVAPAGEQLRFAREETRRTGEGWTHRVEDGRLVVSSASDMTSGDDINITVSVTNADGNASVELFFGVVVVEGRRQPGDQQPPDGPPTPPEGNAGVHCSQPLLGSCTIYYNRSECIAGVDDEVAQCPMPGESYDSTCLHPGRNIIYLRPGSEDPAVSNKSLCELSGGVWTPL